MRVLLFLAFKGLLRSRITSVLLIAAVMAAVGFQIPNTANLDGYTDELLRKGLARDHGHVIISAKNGRLFHGADELADRLRALPFSRGVVSRLVYPASLFVGDETQSMQIAGFEPEREDEATGFCQHLSAGRCPRPEDGDAILVGFRLASSFHLRPGDLVKIAVPFEREKQLLVLWHTFQVAGVLEGAGGFRADYQAFVPLARLRDMFDESDAASMVTIYVDDISRSGEYAKQVMSLSGDGLVVKPWWDEHEFVANALSANRAIARISTAMVICAASLPVIALLYIHVLNERRRIGTLAALGFGRGALFIIYLFKALIVGIVGIGLGNGVGAALCFYFSKHPIFENFGFVVRPRLSLSCFAVPSLVLLATTLFAGLVPAIRASRADPSLELRRD